MFPDGIADVVVAIFERPRAEELRQETESVRKAGHYSYKNEGKSEDQVKKLPELQKAIEAKKSEWKKGLVWPSQKIEKEYPTVKHLGRTWLTSLENIE